VTALATVAAGDLRVRCEVGGPPGAPVVVLSHSLGTDLTMWEPQVPALVASFRVLRYDTRGHGGTTVTPGAYTLAQLAEDVLRLLDALDVAQGHFCGLSMGGLIGMWLGAHAPERVGRLVLSNTAARIGTVEGWNERIRAVRERGMKSIAPAVSERWFSPEFRDRSPEVVERARARLETTAPEGYAGCCAAIRDADERADVRNITAPTLVIVGSLDPSTPPAEGRCLAEAIPGARYAELPASHLSCLEAAEAFTSELIGFLGGEGGS
jgi:3-oxoadipate enol-lactonase